MYNVHDNILPQIGLIKKKNGFIFDEYVLYLQS